MSITDDPTDPKLSHGVDEQPTEMAEKYLVLSQKERDKGFVRPLRFSYIHLTCKAVTHMGRALAETYASRPNFYGATWCAYCNMHRPVGENGEFVWDDEAHYSDIVMGKYPGIKVGT